MQSVRQPTTQQPTARRTNCRKRFGLAAHKRTHAVVSYFVAPRCSSFMPVPCMTVVLRPWADLGGQVWCLQGNTSPMPQQYKRTTPATEAPVTICRSFPPQWMSAHPCAHHQEPLLSPHDLAVMLSPQVQPKCCCAVQVVVSRVSNGLVCSSTGVMQIVHNCHTFHGQTTL